MPLIRLQDASLHPIYPVVKRVMDICISGAVILVGMPLWLIIALLIKLTSKGPVFYKQSRVGADQREFTILKFRTMTDNADQENPPQWTKQNDARRTRLGKYLRRLSIDELPQLLNVIVGHMSLVGPRPERPYFVKRFS